MNAELETGYGRGEIEPKIAPLVDAIRRAGFATFSSCEGHLDDYDVEIPRLSSVGFYASESEARRVHSRWLVYRQKLQCSWVLRAGFVSHRETRAWTLGWTLENCGIKEHGPDDVLKRTLEASWNADIPMLVEMFDELTASNDHPT